MQHKNRLAATASLAIAMITLTACAGSGAGGTPSASDEAAGLSGDCGVATQIAPKDPDGVVASFSEESAARYNGFAGEVQASAWADWAPSSEGPYKVGIAFAALNNPYQSAMLEALEATLKESSEVSEVTTVVATGNDASAQLQQYQALVQQGVDIIVYQPNAADAFVSVVDETAAAGIPSVAVQTAVPTENSVNVLPNSYADSLTVANQVLTNIGGAGNILGVHGVPGIPTDTATFDAFTAAIAQCPDATLIGEVTGGFDPSVAKSEVLQFLSTYTGDVAGVVQTAVMAPGIISAFEESGLPVPAVADIAAQQASLAYWNENQDTYLGAAIGYSPTGTGTAIGNVVLRMLAGDGIKVSDVILQGGLVTSENLQEWVDPSWTTASVGTADGPEGFTPIDEAYLADIFTTSP